MLPFHTSRLSINDVKALGYRLAMRTELRRYRIDLRNPLVRMNNHNTDVRYGLDPGQISQI